MGRLRFKSCHTICCYSLTTQRINTVLPFSLEPRCSIQNMEMTHKNHWREPKTYPVSWIKLAHKVAHPHCVRVFPNLARKIGFQGWVPCLETSFHPSTSHATTPPTAIFFLSNLATWSRPAWTTRSHEIHPVSWLSIKPLWQPNTQALVSCTFRWWSFLSCLLPCLAS